MADYLLCKALTEQRVGKVIVLSLDRPVQELRTILRNAAKDDFIDRKVDVENNIIFVEEVDLNRTFFETIDTITKIGSSTVAIEQTTVVILYSISELVLSYGLHASIPWIKGAVSSVSASKRPILLLTTLHQSLHDEPSISFITSLFPTIAKIMPNYGTISASVAAEVQTIRRSAITGKISESLELLHWKHALLTPLPVQKVPSSGSSKAQQDLAGEQKAEVSVHSRDSNKHTGNFSRPLLLLGPAHAASTSTTVSTSAPALAPPAAGRLITFDSTDPEFDEDSDPDADLDL